MTDHTNAMSSCCCNGPVHEADTTVMDPAATNLLAPLPTRPPARSCPAHRSTRQRPKPPDCSATTAADGTGSAAGDVDRASTVIPTSTPAQRDTPQTCIHRIGNRQSRFAYTQELS